jgi:hypothetical protein
MKTDAEWVAHFKELTGDSKCTICDGNHFTLGNTRYTMVNGKNMMEEFPVIHLICSNCGHTQTFARNFIK